MWKDSHLARERSKSPRNCLREVWYMTFTILISVIRKYKILPLVATEKRHRDIARATAKVEQSSINNIYVIQTWLKLVCQKLGWHTVTN